MATEDEPTTEQAALLVAQAHWLTERYEANSEGYLNRAGIFLGLTGVEAAVIAPAEVPTWARLVALALLLLPSVPLLMVFRRAVILYPSHADLASAVLSGRDPTWLVIDQALKVLDPEASLAAQLGAEADRRGFWCGLGLYALMVVQPLIAATILRGTLT
ncbi:MAG: hypothetical protein ACYC90_10925 [Candidatus Nanopelagicales bacterium]